MISVDKAKEIILKEISALKESEFLAFASCLGRVSAQDIRAKENIPPFNNSAMDGFAVRANGTSGASRRGTARRAPTSVLQVIEDLPAGYAARKSVGSGQAIRIMTGAPIPRGADAVVMVEDTSVKSEIRNPKSETNPKSQIPNSKYPEKEYVEIFKETKSGDNVRYAGEDVKKGEIVIKKGSLLRSGHIGMLASLGVSKIKVYRRPKVGILATGDELVEVGAKLKPGKIRNSNAYSLYSQVIKTGAVPVLLGIARDNKKDLEKKITSGLKNDMLLISGGVSVGDYDFVKDVLKDLGTDMKFWKVAMRPGKPLAFGVVSAGGGSAMNGTKSGLGGKHTPVFGLPGNPVSSMVSFEIFVRPAMLRMMGQRTDEKAEVTARVGEDISKKRGLRYFLRADTRWDDTTYLTRTTGPQGSGQLKSMVLANSIIILPEEKEFIRKGERVTVRFLK